MVVSFAMRRSRIADRMARAEGIEAFQTTAGRSPTVTGMPGGVIITGPPVPKTAVLKSALRCFARFRPPLIFIAKLLIFQPF